MLSDRAGNPFFRVGWSAFSSGCYCSTVTYVTAEVDSLAAPAPQQTSAIVLIEIPMVKLPVRRSFSFVPVVGENDKALRPDDLQHSVYDRYRFDCMVQGVLGKGHVEALKSEAFHDVLSRARYWRTRRGDSFLAQHHGVFIRERIDRCEFNCRGAGDEADTREWARTNIQDCDDIAVELVDRGD